MIWLGGTFGAGKTTTARLLVDGDSSLQLFDPEQVGSLLSHHLPTEGVTDFQQLPSWRRLVPVVADEIARATGRRLVAVQTVLVEDYWHELVAGLSALGHEVDLVVLVADDGEMRRRIEADWVEAGAREWRLRHLADLEHARGWLLAAARLVVDTTGLAPDQVAGAVREGLGLDPAPARVETVVRRSGAAGSVPLS